MQPITIDTPHKCLLCETPMLPNTPVACVDCETFVQSLGKTRITKLDQITDKYAQGLGYDDCRDLACAFGNFIYNRDFTYQRVPTTFQGFWALFIKECHASPR